MSKEEGNCGLGISDCGLQVGEIVFEGVPAA